MSQIQALLSSAARALRPPPALSYSEWAAQNVRLPAGQSAITGRWRPWKFQRIMLDLIGDPLVERVTIPKAARLGYTRSLVAAIAADAANDPCPIILLSPADDDARGMMTDEVDPTFEDSPALHGLMKTGRFDGKNTLTQRALVGGGSLKSLAARSPRNLRRHTARKLYCDEVDGYEITAEGDPIELGEKRTQSYADRKIVIGSTPTLMETSIVWKRWMSSDQGIFEVQCPACEDFFELEWEHIHWDRGEPETAHAICPHCGGVIEERYKAVAVENGRRRALKPEVKGHAGFRLSALVSLQPKATWAILAAEYEEARRKGPSALQVFYNTVLGRPWSSALEHIDQHVLMARREPFGLSFDPEASRWRSDIPAEVLYITVGVDVQIDRLEVTLFGWSRQQRFILGHEIIYGSTTLETTWNELDAMLMTRWVHPLGNEIGVEATAVDSGDGNRTQFVYDFCQPRQHRRVMAIKGMSGARPVIEASKNKKHRRKGVNLHIVGVDQVKTDILTALGTEPTAPNGEKVPGTIRFSDGLETEWFEQLTSERRVVKYRNGKVKVEFDRIKNRAAEALDATVYAIAIRNICRFDFDKREAELTKGGEPKRGAGFKSALQRLQGM
jgi:phage terminase large subunit GpA-like protein